MTRLSNEHSNGHATTEPGSCETMENLECAAQVMKALENLPPSQREVIRLKFQNGFSYREISRISGHSVSNVGFLIHTGLKTLRCRMADVEPIRLQA